MKRKRLSGQPVESLDCKNTALKFRKPKELLVKLNLVWERGILPQGIQGFTQSTLGIINSI